MSGSISRVAARYMSAARNEIEKSFEAPYRRMVIVFVGVNIFSILAVFTMVWTAFALDADEATASTLILCGIVPSIMIGLAHASFR